MAAVLPCRFSHKTPLCAFWHTCLRPSPQWWSASPLCGAPARTQPTMPNGSGMTRMCRLKSPLRKSGKPPPFVPRVDGSVSPEVPNEIQVIPMCFFSEPPDIFFKNAPFQHCGFLQSLNPELHCHSNSTWNRHRAESTVMRRGKMRCGDNL